MSKLSTLLFAALVLVACHQARPPAPPAAASAVPAPVEVPVAPAVAAKPAPVASPGGDARPASRNVLNPDDLATSRHRGMASPEKPLELCPNGEGDPLTRARTFYDKEQFELALACSARACADSPDAAEAHAERAADLVALGRYPDAQLAFTRALALDPDHLDALLGAADLYVTRLPGSRDNDELALVYSERGLKLARKEKQGDLVGSFALESAMAFNDLGRPKEALERADEALKHHASEDDASYEKASALYELCRFADARALFAKLVKVKEKEAFARYHLGLIAERSGDEAQAQKEMLAARELDPDDFPPEVLVTPAEFQQMVDRQLQALPDDMRQDLGKLPVSTQDLPDLEDLVANDPPLSPAILGLFRGPPLGEKCEPGEPEPCRSIVLYRKNLERVTRDRLDLEDQVRVTLLHELGHLRGEDDLQLAARGLE
jgi:tetratricopeptide (TPR) repeat protein